MAIDGSGHPFQVIERRPVSLVHARRGIAQDSQRARARGLGPGLEME
jgi:hypothetical protein